jgi:hypothetical protein
LPEEVRCAEELELEPEELPSWLGGVLESWGCDVEPLEPLDPLEPLELEPELLDPLDPLPLLPLDPLLPPNGSLYWSSPALCATATAGKARVVAAASMATLRRGASTGAQASQRPGDAK